MEKTLKSPAYGRLIHILVTTRRKVGMSQQTLANHLNQHQSFVAKYEGGERRIDVIEFITIAQALGIDPISVLRDFLKAEHQLSAGRPANKKDARRRKD